MKRERMHARGPRGALGLVLEVREQVAKLNATTAKLGEGMAELAADVRKLGQSVNALAEEYADHEGRITRLERKGRRP